MESGARQEQGAPGAGSVKEPVKRSAGLSKRSERRKLEGVRAGQDSNRNKFKFKISIGI